MKSTTHACILMIMLFSAPPNEFRIQEETQPQRLLDGVQEAWVSRYGSGLSPAFDIARVLTTDGEGNVYVAGYSSNSRSGVDYRVVKYDASGRQIWTADYNGTGNGDDLAFAIAADAAGNVYVTGRSAGASSFFDYATVKYNSAGKQIWVVRYNGPGNGLDNPTAILVDQNGNVFVTGESLGAGTSNDYATIKYNSTGVQEWVARYNGPSNSVDEATAMAIDSAGNVYVTGLSSGAIYDYVTIKYNSRGVLQWAARYNGPANHWDNPTAIGVDNSGNVYVTGQSYGLNGPFDYATIKYNGAGVQPWVSRYSHTPNSADGATALAIDATGNIYVSGWSWGEGTNVDYATIKYDSEGAVRWIARYNGPGNDYDATKALTLDKAGNVYVTGWSVGAGSFYDYATIKYDANGVEKWVARYNGPGNLPDWVSAISVDDSANVFVTGFCQLADRSWDYATVKYNDDGVERWSARYNGPGKSYETASDLAIDGSGNVYVTGWSESATTNRDYATVKLNNDGIQQWAVRYNSPANLEDVPVAVAVDNHGNVYVTGRSMGIGTDFDYATIKYDQLGVQQWAARYNAPANLPDEVTALAVDAAGNVYVTGRSTSFESNSDLVTIKYNSFGVEQWVSRYKNQDRFSGGAKAIAIDDSGNVYVTGRSGLSDYLTIKYDSAGIEQWVARSKNLGGAIAIRLDRAGNVYVTGSGYNVISTVKYDARGVEQWLRRYVGPADDWKEASDFAIDDSANVYITGWSETSHSTADYVTIKYNTSGVEQWVARYNRTGYSYGRAFSLAVDRFGNVYVTGSEEGYLTLKYDRAGVLKWLINYRGSWNSYNQPAALAVDAAGNVYLTGTSGFEDVNFYEKWSNFTTIKYTQTTPVSVDEKKASKPQKYHLSQNYPNPCNPSTTIRYALPKSEYVTLKIYNLIGKEIATLVRGKKAAGEYQVQWNAGDLPGGLYLYRLQVGEYVATRKLVLMK